jgi:hypothetical protein
VKRNSRIYWCSYFSSDSLLKISQFWEYRWFEFQNLNFMFIQIELNMSFQMMTRIYFVTCKMEIMLSSFF